jgi:hypothetical protein
MIFFCCASCARLEFFFQLGLSELDRVKLLVCKSRSSRSVLEV